MIFQSGRRGLWEVEDLINRQNLNMRAAAQTLEQGAQ